MKYSVRHVPELLRTPVGRAKVIRGIQHRGWPVLGPLATMYRRTLVRQTRVVAVVGSFGKSTTTRTVACALGAPLHPTFSNNSAGGLALAVLRIRPGQRYAAIEAGIHGPGQMAPYARAIRPQLVVVTSIGSEHHRSFHTLEATRSEKAEMVRALTRSGTAILNGDDPNVRWMATQTAARVITFGFEPGNDIHAADVQLDWPHGTRFTLHAGQSRREVAVRLVGRAMVYPVLAAVAVAFAGGLSLDPVLCALEQLTPTPGRMQPVPLPNGAWVLRDDYKSAVETINSALDVLSQIPAGRRMIALGEVNEPIGAQATVYRGIGERLAGIVSLAVVVGNDTGFRSYAAGAVQGGLARSAVQHATGGVLEAAKMLRGTLAPSDVVLIKGRNEQHLERIALALAGRDVRCDVVRCGLTEDCSSCAMLERGWT